MKKYKKNSKVVDAIQFDGTESTLNEIQELLGNKANAINKVDLDLKTFHLVGKKSGYTIYQTDWIVRDKIDDNIFFFVVSDNIFKITYAEIK